MKKIYYNVWSEAIQAALKKSEKEPNPNWKFNSLVAFSFGQGFNVMTFFLILMYFGINVDIFYDFGLFPLKLINKAISGLTTLFFPYYLINYFLIFWKDRYKKIIIEYPGYGSGGWYFVGYFVGSFLLFIVPVIIRNMLM